MPLTINMPGVLSFFLLYFHHKHIKDDATYSNSFSSKFTLFFNITKQNLLFRHRTNFCFVVGSHPVVIRGYSRLYPVIIPRGLHGDQCDAWTKWRSSECKTNILPALLSVQLRHRTLNTTLACIIELTHYTGSLYFWE